MDENKASSPPGSGEDDLNVEYANNTYFVPNIWDLKVLFGELSGSKPGVDWHTSITLPWAHAKLMSHYLNLQLAAYELVNGKIKVPRVMIPKAPEPPTEEQLKSDTNAKAFYELLAEHHRRLIDEQK